VSYCPKCGNKISEEMSFCPKCGAPLKAEQAAPGPAPTTYRGGEKSEKHEKREKGEKGEKREKREYAFLGPLIGGLILVFIGLTFYVKTSGIVADENLMSILWALFFVIIGVVVVVAAVYGVVMASRRHPRT
jgi:predicted nucleic acid-binding Zn ribbon protein